MAPIGIVIQARMGSSRFPGKVLADFCGKPMLLFQIELLSEMSLDAPVVVATSDKPLDDAVEGLCRAHAVECFRGDELDVFARFRAVVERFGFSHIVRLTGDNPLPHAQVVRACIRKHLTAKPDLTSTRQVLPDRSVRRFVPPGCSVDIVNAQTLLSVDATKLDDFQREHVVPVFFDGNFRVELVKEAPGFSPPPFSVSVDDASDLERVSNYAKDLIAKGRLLKQLGI